MGVKQGATLAMLLASVVTQAHAEGPLSVKIGHTRLVDDEYEVTITVRNTSPVPIRFVTVSCATLDANEDPVTTAETSLENVSSDEPAYGTVRMAAGITKTPTFTCRVSGAL